MTDSPLDQARAAVAQCRAALNRTADALHSLQPIASDPLTVAFIALGVREAGWPYAPNYGQLEIIAAAVAHAALLDLLYIEHAEEFGGCFAYDVAEPFGFWFASQWATDKAMPQVDDCRAEALRLTLACCTSGTEL